LQRRWEMPLDSAVGMLAYAMVQELATGLNYRNLRRRVERQGDPALSRLLGLLSVDEQAHHNFFLRAVQLFLDTRGVVDVPRGEGGPSGTARRHRLRPPLGWAAHVTARASPPASSGAIARGRAPATGAEPLRHGGGPVSR
jgi:hypothetical protein